MVVVKVQGPGKLCERLVHILGDVSNNIQGTKVKLDGLTTPKQKKTNLQKEQVLLSSMKNGALASRCTYHTHPVLIRRWKDSNSFCTKTANACISESL